MARKGRKKLRRLDLEGRNKLFNDLKRFLNSNLGTKKRYVLVMSYEAEPEGGNKVVHTQTFSNLYGSDPLTIWKMILLGLTNRVQNLLTEYSLETGVEERSTVEPKPPSPRY